MRFFNSPIPAHVLLHEQQGVCQVVLVKKKSQHRRIRTESLCKLCNQEQVSVFPKGSEKLSKAESTEVPRRDHCLIFESTQKLAAEQLLTPKNKKLL